MMTRSDPGTIDDKLSPSPYGFNGGDRPSTNGPDGGTRPSANGHNGERQPSTNGLTVRMTRQRQHDVAAPAPQARSAAE